MAEVWLVCEGDTDAQVLRSVFTAVLSAEIAVEPARGSANLGAVAEFIRKQRGGTVAYVADRDYRRKEMANASFEDGKPAFLWRRHSIENYLIEPSVIAVGFERLQRSMQQIPHGPPKWVNALPTDIETIAEALRECASSRASQEAGRMSIYRLWEDISDSAGRIQKRVPDALTSGSQASADECRQAVVAEAARIAAKSNEAKSSPHLAEKAISQRYDQVLASISSNDFLDRGGFLEEFHGKDLLRQFQAWLRERANIQLKVERLTSVLSGALPVVYGKEPTLFGTDDFRELANGVRSLAELPVLA